VGSKTLFAGFKFRVPQLNGSLLSVEAPDLGQTKLLLGHASALGSLKMPKWVECCQARITFKVFMICTELADSGKAQSEEAGHA
jgi:hypothetical protein